MANSHDTLTALFSDIADAIRAKTGKTESIIADNFPSEIAAIQAGGGASVEILSATVTDNGMFEPGVNEYNLNIPNLNSSSRLMIAIVGGNEFVSCLLYRRTLSEDFVKLVGNMSYSNDNGYIVVGRNLVRVNENSIVVYGEISSKTTVSVIVA